MDIITIQQILVVAGIAVSLYGLVRFFQMVNSIERQEKLQKEILKALQDKDKEEDK